MSNRKHLVYLLALLITAVMAVPSVSQAYGVKCRKPEYISPGFYRDVHKRHGQNHFYVMRLHRGEMVRLHLHQKQNIRHELIGIRLRYRGGNYEGTPYNPCELIVTSDPHPIRKRDRSLKFICYATGDYVIEVFGINQSGGLYDLDIKVEKD